MGQFHIDKDIPAEPDKIWSILTDFEQKNDPDITVEILEQEIITLKNQLKSEKQLNHKVDLNIAIQGKKKEHRRTMLLWNRQA